VHNLCLQYNYIIVPHYDLLCSIYYAFLLIYYYNSTTLS